MNDQKNTKTIKMEINKYLFNLFEFNCKNLDMDYKEVIKDLLKNDVVDNYSIEVDKMRQHKDILLRGLKEKFEDPVYTNTVTKNIKFSKDTHKIAKSRCVEKGLNLNEYLPLLIYQDLYLTYKEPKDGFIHFQLTQAGLDRLKLQNERIKECNEEDPDLGRK